jgi:hypothetical protein
VVVPPGRRRVTDDRGAPLTVDFDAFYDEVLAPAVRAVRPPGGGALEPVRAGPDALARDPGLETFRLLEQARVVLADLTGLGPGAAAALALRHRAWQPGTVLVRRAGAFVPADLARLQAFAYDGDAGPDLAGARDLVAAVLADAFAEVGRAAPPAWPAAGERRLVDAERALRGGDPGGALGVYRALLAEQAGSAAHPGGGAGDVMLLMRVGLLLSDAGRWDDALAAFGRAADAAPAHAEAYRERGIAEATLFEARGRPAGAPDGMRRWSARWRSRPTTPTRTPRSPRSTAARGGPTRRWRTCGARSPRRAATRTRSSAPSRSPPSAAAAWRSAPTTAPPWRGPRGRCVRRWPWPRPSARP